MAPQTKVSWRNPARRLVRGVRRRVRRFAGRVLRIWRRSLQLRVVVKTLAISASVVAVLGIFLMDQISTGLVQSKQASASAAARADRQAAAVLLNEEPVAGVSRLDNAALALAGRAGPSQRYEVVIIAPPAEGFGRSTLDFDSASVPADLQHKVTTSDVAQTKFAPMRYVGSKPDQPGLVIGGRVPGGYQIYHFFPLAEESAAISLVQRILLSVGVALVLLLAAIASLVTRQVVTPVRLARQAAERLASGQLEERLKVRGEDDLARLATSFNDMARNLEVKIHQLEELSKVQRQFVSDVSHELRTPLTTVRMAADLLYETREDFDPASARSAELMQNQLNRFEAMLADLLEISRYDSRAATLDVDSVDMRDIVLRAVGDSEALAERNSIKFVLRLPGEPCMAEVDSRRVERILRNLLFNAIEHGEGKDVVVQVAVDRDAVAVAVRDHGVGLKPGTENLVFDRFWRADPSRARTIGGTGLGLAISREDALLHGGWLQAWGLPGEGSQFRLSLPRVAGSELKGSPLSLAPAEIELRRVWGSGLTPGEDW
ncbi:MtrAB system histidine kinase MtrB [Rhizohabitans arisaemae]|uniref:MtrAB system histidine kinase MtrB n=1 Tax=Rhizohabitans arisaemae TaxID=2720610 RepID=UPI0024B1018E|nr:MtrAB system histidine kinase MtrB [Rhizohabitans arisaemae]